MKILDCTLRDGGYYTQWDFDKPTVDQYIFALNKLPVDYIELGYRSPLQDSYFGKYYYLPLYELKDIRKKTDKKLAIILNENDIREEDLPDLLEPIVGLVDMVRFAIKPENLDRAIELVKKIKDYGFEISFNLMYLSKWKDDKNFINSLERLNGLIDVLYLVDSYGSIIPKELKEPIKRLKAKLDCKLGFHGHNNLEAALLNSLTAIDLGVDFIDSTILGMGRGAGNLKTELLLTVLNKKNDLKVNFNELEKAVSAFKPLQNRHSWGTSLPYMISGAYSLPQKEIMEWTTVRYYTLNAIIRALNNKRNEISDNEKFPICSFPKTDKALVVGGGPSIKQHIDGILRFIENNPEIIIIHASAKNAGYFKDLKNKQFFCLVGNEGRRMEATLKDLSHFNGVCILPPFPRKMGTYVPEIIKDKTEELEKIWFTDKYLDAHTTLALQIALNCKPEHLYFVGYDSYKPESISQKEMELIEENQYLFEKLSEFISDFSSLTKTHYDLVAHDNLFYRLSK
ncbi:MAG TPA: aldolase catalytic domain-containing protein [Flavobacteriaceae bacterium]|nr:aldolase catalytic domain-containing protein [Flavobacteriaceae bacterium]